MSKEIAGKFAVVRWLNDNNRLSVHNQKFFMEPKKQTYIPGDEGVACYPGYPGKWQFRVLAVGEKKEMNVWLDSNFNILMADESDKDFITASQLEVSSTSQNKKEQAGGATVKLKEQNGDNLVKQKEQIGVDTTSPVKKAKTDVSNNGASARLNKQNVGVANQQTEQTGVTSTTPAKSQKQNGDKQKEQTCAVLKTQKDLAEFFLSKRTTECETRDMHKDCVSKKEFNELKETVRSLKSDLRRIKKKVCPELEQTTPRKSEVTHKKATPKKKHTPKKISPIKISPQKTPTKGSPSFNGYTKSQLEDAVAHTDELYAGIKTLMLMLFPENYIITHSISGKPSNSKMEAKPALDSRLYNMLLSIVKQKFGTSSKDVTAKVQSVMKWVQKKSKK